MLCYRVRFTDGMQMDLDAADLFEAATVATWTTAGAHGEIVAIDQLVPTTFEEA